LRPRKPLGQEAVWKEDRHLPQTAALVLTAENRLIIRCGDIPVNKKIVSPDMHRSMQFINDNQFPKEKTYQPLSIQI